MLQHILHIFPFIYAFPGKAGTEHSLFCVDFNHLHTWRLIDLFHFLVSWVHKPINTWLFCRKSRNCCTYQTEYQRPYTWIKKRLDVGNIIYGYSTGDRWLEHITSLEYPEDEADRHYHKNEYDRPHPSRIAYKPSEGYVHSEEAGDEGRRHEHEGHKGENQNKQAN